MITSGAPFIRRVTVSGELKSAIVAIYFLSVLKGSLFTILNSSLSFLYGNPFSCRYTSIAPSVGFPTAFIEPSAPSSISAVELSAISAAKFLSGRTEQYCTCILFWVRVPVLSVQITVVAPIVSQACIFLTRVFPAVILRIL